MKSSRLYLIAGLLFWLTSTSVSSHTTAQTSSQLTIFDGRAELVIHIDIDAWITRLQNPEAWLLGETEVLLYEPQLTPSRRDTELYKLLETGTELYVDGENVPLAPIKKGDSLNNHVAEFRFFATFKIDSPHEITIKFPKSLGEVQFSIFRPISSSVPAGSMESFSLR